MPPPILERLYPKGISSMMVGKVCIHPIFVDRIDTLTFNQMGIQYIEDIKKQVCNDNFKASDTKKSVFHHLLTSDIPESEKSTSRLQAESIIFLIAGTFTSAHTLSMILYHVLSNPHIKKRLRGDLKDVMACYPAQNPPWADLEKVTYLQACIKEALRYVLITLCDSFPLAL